ncbi:MAG: glycosyltransferase, partial [Thermoleophilia bacterium]|nr:glycosyltransferase [Thermoleophilia bacterium]
RLSPVGWDAARPARLLVVASWAYAPNAHGLRRFLKECWPRVLKAVPDATLDVAGRMPPALVELCAASPGVRTLGFVTDLASVYASCVAAVAPVYYGGGTKIKVLEALAHGRPCAVTGHAHRGYELPLPDGRGVLVGDTDEALAAACARLLREDGLARSMGEAGAGIVAEVFSESVLSRTVVSAVESAMRRRRDGRG